MYEHMYRQEDEHWWFRGRRAVIRALLARTKLPANPRILDAGCGTGRNLTELQRLGTASGVDFSALAIDYCRARGIADVHRAGLEALPFDTDSFDLLLLADVIEHVDDDVAVLRELHRVAAPGAVLAITTPAYRWLWSQHDETCHHRRRYTRPELRERAGAAGWRPVTATYFNSLLLPPIFLTRRLFGRRRRERADLDITPGALNPVLEFPMRLEAGLIRRGVSLPFGVSIGMVCRPDAVPVQPALQPASGAAAHLS